ncbi:ParD-like family protein [Rothia sp. AR01]|uniref:ParD-like family protein n=1 Tax=Rothia santali TaxID=2949643 RepID=A0A9X2KHQ1_9MICC|nr:ParD-like family protein [Rothia santali]MCP3425019.1 ParD-like family protein [Rothia santali]
MSDMTSIHVDRELAAQAHASGERDHRSVDDQISHWARIGRALESASLPALSEIRAVLDGEGSYDDLPETTQAVVRGAWDERMDQHLRELDLVAEFTEAGRGWSEVDAEGRLVRRLPGVDEP